MLTINESLDNRLQLRKAFHCPIEPDISVIKRMTQETFPS
jgi:hypothetical protein